MNKDNYNKSTSINDLIEDSEKKNNQDKDNLNKNSSINSEAAKSKAINKTNTGTDSQKGGKPSSQGNLTSAAQALISKNSLSNENSRLIIKKINQMRENIAANRRNSSSSTNKVGLKTFFMHNNNNSEDKSNNLLERKLEEDAEKEKILEKEIASFTLITKDELGFVDEKQSQQAFFKFKFEDFISLILLTWNIYCSISYYEIRYSHINNIEDRTQIVKSLETLRPVNTKYKRFLVCNTIFFFFNCK